MYCTRHSLYLLQSLHFYMPAVVFIVKSVLRPKNKSIWWKLNGLNLGQWPELHESIEAEIIDKRAMYQGKIYNIKCQPNLSC